MKVCLRKYLCSVHAILDFKLYVNKNKFEFWIASVENVAQILGQNFLHMTLTKMIGSPLLQPAC